MQFYLDDLEDELTTTALRMLVKDLLILFQAGNEGVINVLGILLIVFPRGVANPFNRSLDRTLFRNVSRRRPTGPHHLPTLLQTN